MRLFSESFSKLLVPLNKTVTNTKRHCSLGLNKIQVLKISPDSKNNDDIVHFMRQHCPDEPLNRAFGLTPKDDIYKYIEQQDLQTIKDGLSVKAVDSETGKIKGLCLVEMYRPGYLKAWEMDSIDDDRYQKIFGLLYKLESQVDLFEKYKVNKVVNYRIILTDREYRALGLAKHMALKVEKLTEAAGIKVIKGDCTSYFSYKVALHMGYKTVCKLRYKDFVDENGKPIYNMEPPHDYCQMVVKVLGSTTDSDDDNTNVNSH